MIIRRVLATFVAAAVAVMLSAGVAAADPTYPPTGPTGGGSVSDTQVPPGQTFTFHAIGYKPLSLVTITYSLFQGGSQGTALRAALRGETFTTKADAKGEINVKLSIDTQGTFLITASGVDPSGAPHYVASVVVVKKAAKPVPGGGTTGKPSKMPRTGADLTWLYAGLGLVLAGGVLVLTTRTRSSRLSI